jgi:hypothetical protein
MIGMAAINRYPHGDVPRYEILKIPDKKSIFFSSGYQQCEYI